MDLTIFFFFARLFAAFVVVQNFGCLYYTVFTDISVKFFLFLFFNCWVKELYIYMPTPDIRQDSTAWCDCHIRQGLLLAAKWPYRTSK